MAKTFVRTTKHPKKDLFLCCYTKSAFYQKKWDNQTINARGHVYDANGALLSCPFSKIFNLDEHSTTEKDRVVDLIYNNFHDVEFHTKYNGHLSILFNDGEEWINTTKGSFDHDFVELDRIVIESSGYTDAILDQFPEEWTCCFEIIADYDPHLMTETHITNIGGEHAVLLGVNDRDTGLPIRDFKNKVFQIFDSMGADRPFIPESTMAKDVMYIRGCDEDEAKDIIAGCIDDLILDMTDTEGWIIHIPSINFRVKLKTKWFLYNRYLNQFNTEKTKKIFDQYEDSEEAFNAIPEELHEAYQKVIDDYLKFAPLYREKIMTAFESICEAYKTKHELVSYINTCSELGTLERKVMIAFMDDDMRLPSFIKEQFMVHYTSFDLVKYIK